MYVTLFKELQSGYFMVILLQVRHYLQNEAEYCIMLDGMKKNIHIHNLPWIVNIVFILINVVNKRPIYLYILGITTVALAQSYKCPSTSITST